MRERFAGKDHRSSRYAKVEFGRSNTTNKTAVDLMVASVAIPGETEVRTLVLIGMNLTDASDGSVMK